MHTMRDTTSATNSMSTSFRRGFGSATLTLLAPLALVLTLPARGETRPPAIPVSDIGARATANYQGDALGVTATPDSARLRCGFQQLEGHATPEGLWLESSKPGAGQLRVVAVAVGRGEALAGSAQDAGAEGTSENSPAFQRWGRCVQVPSREATAQLGPRFGSPFGTSSVMRPSPTIKRWAIIERPSGTELLRTGKVSAENKLVRFTRPGLTEEYSVSVDGVRQDFVIESPPLNSQPSTLNHSAGDLRVELALSGGWAEATASGARLTLEGSRRTLTYGRLRVEDATGRELPARLQVLSADRLAVSVADANATYPVRIDPTFTDADWVSLGSVMGSPYLAVHALAVSGTDLYAGGQFTTAGGVPANNIAKWNAGRWSALGSGIDLYVYALAVSGTNLYAGGWFTTAGGVPANRIAKWDGSTWSALGSGINANVIALAVSGTDLYAGGDFTTAGGVPANGIAKWNGHAWSALGSGIAGPMPGVYALAVIGTNLYAAGDFTTAGGVPANCIAKWDGSAWSALESGVGPSRPVFALAVSGTDLYATGVFTTAGGVAATNIAKWNGSRWSALGSGINDDANALAVSGTNLYAGGWFTTAGGVPANRIAKWDGSAWSALGSGIGLEGCVAALAADGAGHLFVGENFWLAGTNGSRITEAILEPRGPTILKPPLTQSAEVGATVHLAVNATGEPSPVYQWYFNRTNRLSCARSDLVLTNLLFSQSGTYTVVAINEAGAVTSAPVMLNVIAPVPRRLVPGVNLMGQAGNPTGLDYRDNLGPTANWQTMATITLSNAPQYYFDVSEPFPPQRFYRARQTGTPGVMPSLDLHLVPAITLAGDIGHSVRLDYINQVGPTDAWVTLATVTLTNTSQLYFDTSARGQPQRLYRVVPSP